MAKNNNEYIVKIGADIKNLKKDIKAELESVLREVDNVGDAMSKGITPDTKEFENKIASLESKMEKLAKNTKNVEDQVSSMKTAFKGFAELEASMKVISEQNKAMYDTFVKMSPYLHEFANTFTAMKPEQASRVFAAVMQNMSASGNAGTQVFKDMQNAAQQTADITKKSFHDIETGIVGGVNAANNAVETLGHSVDKVVEGTKYALEELKNLNKTYNTDKNYKGIKGQETLRTEIEEQIKAYNEFDSKMGEYEEGTSDYNRSLLGLVETGQKLLALYEKLDASNPRSSQLKGHSIFDGLSGDIQGYLKEYEKVATTIPTQINAQISKVELKPLKLKVDISDDGKLLEQVNKQIDALSANPGLHKVEIPMMFVDTGDIEDNGNSDKTTDKVGEKIERSLKKQIERLNKSFDNTTPELEAKIKKFKKDIDESLTLKFEWQKGNNAGEIENLFRLVQNIAFKNPITIYPDTQTFISKIEEAINSHTFNLNITGNTQINGNLSGLTIPSGLIVQNSGQLTPIRPAIPKKDQDVVPAQNERKSDPQTDTKDEKITKDNTASINENTDAVKVVAETWKKFITAQTRSLKSKSENTKFNAEARLKRLRGLTFDERGLGEDEFYNAVSEQLKRENLIDVLSGSNSKVKSSKGSDLSLITRSDLVNIIKESQTSMGVNTKTSAQISREINNEMYFSHAKSLAKMGKTLKDSYSDVAEGMIPTIDDLEAVVSRFKKIDKSNPDTDMTAVADSADELIKTTKQLSKKYAKGGELQEHLSKLRQDMSDAQSILDDESATKKDKRSAQSKYNKASKQYNAIMSDITPVAETFEAAVKKVRGDISNMLQGYSFEIIVKGEKDARYFNDPKGGDRNTKPYWGSSNDFFDDLEGKEYGINTTHIPNESYLRDLYGERISKKQAIESIVDAYSKLDTKARQYVDTLIDINKLTDESLTIGEKFDYLENSYVFDRNNKEGIGRSKASTRAFDSEEYAEGKKKIRSNKSKLEALDDKKDKEKIQEISEENKVLEQNVGTIVKANRAANSFFEVVTDKYFAAVASTGLSKGQQAMLNRGFEKGIDTSTSTAYIPPSERKYTYTDADKAYRTVPTYAKKTIEENRADLANVNNELNQTSNKLQEYRTSLEQAIATQKEQREKFDDTAERKALRDKYTNITDKESFYKAHTATQQDAVISSSIVHDLQTKANKEQKNLNKLSSELQETEQAINAIQSRMQDVSAAGGVQKYLDQLNKGINEYKTFEKQIQAIEKQLTEDLRSLKSLLGKGEISQEEYDFQEKEINEAIAENNKELKERREKYSKLALTKDSFAAESTIRDKSTGKIRQITDEEYFAKKRKEMAEMQTRNDSIQQNINDSETRIAQVNSELSSAQIQYEAHETALQKMRYAFAEEYYEYITDQLGITKKEFESVKKLKNDANVAYTSAENKVNSTKTGLELSQELYDKATTEESKKKHLEQIERLKVEHENAKKVFELAKTNKEKIEKRYATLESRKSYLAGEESKISSILHPNITTDKDGEVKRLKQLIADFEQTESELSARKSRIEKIINGDEAPSPQAPFDSMSDESKKIAVVREVEKINHDLELAQEKINEAKQNKIAIENEIDYINQSKGKADFALKKHNEGTRIFAEQELSKTNAFKEAEEKLRKDLESLKITEEEYDTKVKELYDKLIADDKSGRFNPLTKETYEAQLKKNAVSEQVKINDAVSVQERLKKEKEAALAKLGVTEKELFNQREIRKEKEKQADLDKQSKSVKGQQDIETRVEEKVNQVNETRIQELDNKMSAIDDEVTKLKAEIESEPKKEQSKKTETKKATQRQKNAFQKDMALIKAQELKKAADIKGMDFSESVKLLQQLNTLEKQGKENTEEYIALQIKLSKLINENKQNREGTGRNKYASKQENYDWIEKTVGADVADFYNSDKYIAKDNKASDAVSKKIGASLIENIPDNIVLGCIEASNKAEADAKVSGKKGQQVKNAAADAVKRYLKSVEQGVTESVVEESKESTSDIASKKARIKELTKQKAQLQAEKDNIISQGSIQQTELPYSTVPLSADQMAVQAGTVIIGGTDGSGPWARETTLGETNAILSSIKSKIDAVNGSSGSGDDSSAGGSGNKKKKKTNDPEYVASVETALRSKAAENRKAFDINGLEDGIKSVQKFDSKALKLYETFTLANGETVKFTYSIDKMTGEIKTAYTTIANFENVAKKAYTELGANKVLTSGFINDKNFNFPVDKVSAYNNALTQLDSKLKNLGENGITNPQDAAEVKILTDNVKKARTEIENMVKASSKIANEHSLVKAFGSEDINNVKEQMKALAQEINKGAITFHGFNEETNELTFSVKNSSNELTTLTYKFDQLTKSVYQTGHASKTTTGFFRGFFSDVGSKIGQLARYYTGMSLLTEAFQRVRQGVQYVRDIDLALTELKKVTDESESSYHRFLQTMSNTASVVGSTVSELTNSAAAWARLGYSMEEAGELAKNTAILLNVSEFESEEQATEALISSLQAFNYEAKDSIKIVDKLNIIGNNFAISSNGIAEGLSRSASTLVSAGNSLEESIAMLAAGNKVQQDPEGLGNALKVLSMRIRGTKTDLEEAGEETEGMIENTSKLQAKVKALTDVDGSGGVDILTDTGAYKSTYQILLEIAEVWDRINETDPKNQAALLEILAGKTRGSQVASILQNPEDLRDAYKMALNSDGSAQQELETYLDSIQGRIDLFTNELQTFWMNLINSNVIKLFVDAGTTILEVLNAIMGIIDKVAEGWGSFGVIIPTVLASFGAYKFKKENSITNIFDMFSIGVDKIKNLQIVKDTIKSYSDAISNMSTKAKATDILAEFANFDDASGQLGALSQLLKCKDENTEVSKRFVEAMLKEHATELGLSDATIQAVLSSETFTVAQTGAATSTNIFTASVAKLKTAMSTLWTALGPVGVAVIATTAAIAAATVVYQKFFSHAAKVNKLKDTTEKLEEVQKKLKSLNEELETTESRIRELENKDYLTFTEESELARLKEINSELERSIRLEEAKEKREKQNQASDALETVATDKNLQDQYTGSFSYASDSGSDEPTNLGNKWEQNLTALESAYKDLENAKQELENAQASGIGINSNDLKEYEKNVEKAENRIESLNNTIDGLNNDWQKTYENVGYIENATTAEEKAWNERFRQRQEYITKQAWLNKDIGKADILNNIFGAYANDAAKQFKEEFEKAIKSGQNPAQVIADLLENEEYKDISSKLMLEYNFDLSDVVGYFTDSVEYASKANILVTSLDTLTSKVDAYKAAIQTVNNITYDGQAISEDYYNTLKTQISDATVAEEGFSDAIEEQNGKYIVKNISLLNKLVAQSKNAQRATIQMAKAQAQLQYKNLVQQMRNSIIYMGAQAGAYSIVSQAVEENIWMMEDQLDTLKQTIQQYSLLELSLSDAANAFDEYEKAKERDAQLTYDDSMFEMLKTIDEGLLKNETGTEAFEYAVRAIIPEQFWKDIDDVDEKVRSIHDYIDGDNVFSRFFYVDEESGDLDITTDNVREFVDLCLQANEAGKSMFEGTSTDFSLSDDVQGIEDFAEHLGVTEAVALAMLTALEKVDAKWGNILTEVTMTPFDRGVYSTMQTMAELNSQLTDGSITAEEYAKQMATAEKNLDSYTQTAKTRLLGSDNGTPDDASDDTVGFIAKNKQVVTAQEKVNKATDELVQKQKEYNKAVEDGVNGEALKSYEDAVNEATVKVNEHTSAWSKLIEERGKYPTEYEIELVIADIDKEIEASGSKFNQAIKDNFHLDSNGYYVINAGVDIKKLEESVPGIKKYIELLNSKTEVQAFADTTSAEEDVNQFQSTVDGVIQAIENNLITLDLDEEAVNNIVEQANKILSGIMQTLGVTISASMPNWMKTVLKWMGLDVDNTSQTPVVDSVASDRTGSSTGKKYRINGTGRALGSNGLKTSEHNAVVGELGPEMIVDPVKGIYYTVGENGTEVIDLPKGAIIYNHKQTEELLKKGYTSRGNYTGGLSFANGNAHAGISHGLPSYHPNLKDETSFANYTRVNTKWDDATSTLLHAADALADASNDASDAFEDAINWIDVLFTRIENNISEQEAYYETLIDTSNATYSKTSDALAVTSAEIAELGRQMQNAYSQAKVDLTKRPRVSWEKMHEAGWYTEEGSYSTVDTATYWASDFGLGEHDDNDYLINVTPILPDGTVISGGNNGLIDYIRGKLGEGKSIEELDIFLGSYETIEKASSEANKLHEMQEEYYAMVKDYGNSTSSITTKESILNNIYAQLYSRANASLASANYYRNKAAEEMAGLPTEIQNRIKSGAIDIQEFRGAGNEEADKVLEKQVDKINKAIEYYDKISEYEQQYYTTITEIADKAVEHQEDVAQGFENEIGLVEHLNNTLEARNDLQETKEGFALKAYYDAQIDANEIMLDQYRSERDALQDVLDTEVRLGHVKVGDQQWFDMQQAIYDVDDAIIDTEASIEDLQNSINDLHWAKFDELINRYEYVGDEIGNIIQLLSHDPDGLIMEELRDLTSGNWATDSGLTTIGMYAQEMERAQHVANQYADAIKDLEKDYAAGKYNETEYLNKLNELISAQYENIEKYYDAKDAIVELNSARVDAIRDGIEKEIDAYQELIDKKKELLDSEQNLHDFQNEIQDKEKEVADIRKQLAAMDGDTTAATTAKKKQLEAELVEAQKSLEESYYSHSMTARQEALDKEFESFEEEKNKEIEKWEEWLTETETVISESLTYVQENTQLVYNTLTEMGSQYGLTLSTTITEPWTNGEFAIDSYSKTFETATSAFTKQLDNIATHWNNVTTAAEEAARMQAKALQQEYKNTTNEITTSGSNSSNTPIVAPQTPTNNGSSVGTNINTPKAISVGGKINAGSAKIYDYAGDTSGELQYYRNDPIYTVLQEKNGYLLVRHHKLKSGYTGWFKKSDVKAYASGANKIDKDQWALLNELGPELQLVPGANGNIEYVKYGTSIVPADISSKLIDLALDPTSVFDGIKTGIKTPVVETKDFNYEFNFDSLLHVDNASNDSIPALQKMIRSEFNTMMSQVNNKIKRSGKS